MSSDLLAAMLPINQIVDLKVFLIDMDFIIEIL